MHSVFHVLAAILFTGFLTADPVIGGPKNSATDTFPSGIHYAVERSSLHPDRWRDELQHTYDCQDPCSVAFDDRIAAVHLRYKWMQLNPEKDVYDFSDLGEVVDKIQKSEKKVTLVIMAGKYTPNWVFVDGAQHIAMEAKTGDQYSQPLVPLPWDPVFLHAYGEMIKSLGVYLHRKKSRYNTVAMVKNGATVVHSGETRLMPREAFKAAPDKESKRRTEIFQKELCQDWAQSGYLESKVIDAVHKVNEQISTSFPDKHLGLAYVGGSQRFPTVDASGKCRYPAKNSTMNRIIREIVNKYGGRAIINNTVLTDQIGNPPIMKWVKENGAEIGFQVNRQLVGCREGSANPCDKELFKRTIKTGTDAGAMFIEVHDGNIHRYKDLLPKMNKRLEAR